MAGPNSSATPKRGSRKSEKFGLPAWDSRAWGRMKHEEFSDRLFEKLESEPAIVPANFSDEVDRIFMRDASRRAAILFLSKPWKEMSLALTEDRDLAKAYADIAESLRDSIDRQKALLKLLQSAQVRIMAAMCGREDMQQLQKEAKNRRNTTE